MKYIKKLRIPFYFDLKNSKDMIIDELSLISDDKAKPQQEETFLENFNFFAKRENEKNRLIIKDDKNSYFKWMNTVLLIIKKTKSKEKLEEFEDSIKGNLTLCKSYFEIKGDRFLKGEPTILQDLKTAISYYTYYFKDGEEWKEAEDVFSKDSYASLKYAKHTKKPFPKGEDAISKKGIDSVEYARFFKIRFKKCEETLLKDKYVGNIIEYLKLLIDIGETWEEGKKELLSTSLGAYTYCNILNKRDPEAERVILNDNRNIHMILNYTRDVIKGRWPDGEKKILSFFIKNHKQNNEEDDYDVLFDYAKGVGERIPIFEPYLVKSVRAMNYAIDIIKGRWPELEKRIRKFNSDNILEYVRFTGHTWEEAEKILLARNTEGKFANENKAESYIRSIINNENISPYVKSVIDEFFSKINDKNLFVHYIFHRFENFSRLDYFKESLNKNIPKIIKIIDTNEFSYRIIKDRLDNNVNVEDLFITIDDLIYRLYYYMFYKLIDDNNKKLLDAVTSKALSNALKIIKEKELYKYPLVHQGEALTSIKNNAVAEKIINLFNEERSKEYAYLNGSENIKRINSIKDDKEKRREVEENALLVKRTLSKIIKYN